MRFLVTLVAMLLTAGAGIPSAPLEMAAHCAGHSEEPTSHHEAPAHPPHGDTHCPAHSCASTSPCSTASALLATDPQAGGLTIGAVPRVAARQGDFASRDHAPSPPPPRPLSA